MKTPIDIYVQCWYVKHSSSSVSLITILFQIFPIQLHELIPQDLNMFIECKFKIICRYLLVVGFSLFPMCDTAWRIPTPGMANLSVPTY